MPKWVNAYERTPSVHGNYFVIIDGRKDIIHQQAFQRKIEFSTSLLWLEEDQPKKGKGGYKKHSSYFNQFYGR